MKKKILLFASAFVALAVSAAETEKEPFKVTSISPDLNEAQTYWSDQEITVNTNRNDEIGLTTLTVTDESDPEFAIISSNYSVRRQLGDPSAISWTVGQTEKFYEGHSYHARLVFYNGPDEFMDGGVPTDIVGEAEYTFTGTVKGYEYSEAEFISVSPEPYSFISTPQDAVFTYTFSAPVVVYKALNSKGLFGAVEFPETCLSSNEEQTVWTLDLSDNADILGLDSELTIQVYAKDLDGFQVKGNEGIDGDSHIETSWVCELGAEPIVIVYPEEDANLERLTKVVVKSGNGETMNFSWTANARIESMTRAGVGGTLYAPEGESDFTECTFTKWYPDDSDDPWTPVDLDLSETGRYRIVIEKGYFIFGEEFASKVSHSISSNFYIGDPGEDPSDQSSLLYSSVSIEPGSTVDSLEHLYINFPEEISMRNIETGEPIFDGGIELCVYNVTNSADPVLACHAELSYDDNDWCRLNISLDKKITEAGTYEIKIDKGCIVDLNYDGENGKCNPEFLLIYTVSGQSGVEIIDAVANSDVYDMYGRIVVRGADSEQISNLPKGIYIVNGRKLVMK